ncbi:MAG: MarR family winged helix-turn-helix transcriptional regulator [Eubacterium sp.]
MEKTKSEIKYSDYLHEQDIMDDLYSTYQKLIGLSDAEFCCLFSVYKLGCRYQHEISHQRFMNKQTVSSALKQLKKKGLIRLEIPPENQRVRRVILTDEGIKFAKENLDSLSELEEKAWCGLTQEEQAAILEGMRRINSVLSSALKTK